MTKLIIEKITNDLYAYMESDDHYELAQEYRTCSKKLSPAVLDDECDLSELPNHSYIVFELAKIKKTAKKKTVKKKAAKKKRTKKKARGK